MNGTLMNESYLKDDCDYYRHRCVDSKLESILKSGITVKGGKKWKYTFEHASSNKELLEATGYLEANSKGEGDTVDLYVEVPEYLIKIPGFDFDKLRLSKYEYSDLLETVLFPNALKDPNYQECKYFLMYHEYYKEQYEKLKKDLTSEASHVLEALEPLYIKKEREIEEKTDDDPNTFKPTAFDFFSVYEPEKTIVPFVFIKYIVTKDGVILNSAYLDNLNKELQGKIIAYIEEKCKVELRIS